MLDVLGPSPHSIEQLATDPKGTAIGVGQEAPTIHQAIGLPGPQGSRHPVLVEALVIEPACNEGMLFERSGHMTYETWIGLVVIVKEEDTVGATSRRAQISSGRASGAATRVDQANVDPHPEGVDKPFDDAVPGIVRHHHLEGIGIILLSEGAELYRQQVRPAIRRYDHAHVRRGGGRHRHPQILEGTGVATRSSGDLSTPRHSTGWIPAVTIGHVGQTRVSIVVTVREGYSRSLESLESLWASTNEPFRLVWVASGLPRQMRAQLEQYARERQFTLIRTSRYLSPNLARNVGLSLVDTEWVVFIDNDVIFEFGWLEKLLACANETQAAVVGPLYCIGPPSRNRIHMAGGLSRIVDNAGGRDLSETHYFHERDLADVGSQLQRMKTELVEFHCMLVRRSVLRRTGPLDEGLTALCEHNDICMKVQALDEEVWFEPAARVTYVPTVKTLADYLCFCYRWRDSASRATIKHFWASWNLTSNSPAALELMRFATEHRALGQPRPKRVNAAYSAHLAVAVGQIGRVAARRPRIVVMGTADQRRAIA